MQVLDVEEMLTSTLGLGKITNMEQFDALFATYRNYDVGWEQYIEYRVLSHFLYKLIGGGRCYIHFNEYGIWPSSENRFLLKALANFCLGADLDLRRAIKFEENEGEAAMSFLQLGLQFGWGGVFITDRDKWFQFDHDSRGNLSTPNDAVREMDGIYGVRVSRSPDAPVSGSHH